MKNNTDKISIAIVSYNHAKYLKDFYVALERVIKASKVKDFEIIHFDDYSTDNTIEILQSIEIINEVSRSEKNLGLGATLLRVLNFSYTGEVVTLISADDIFYLNYFDILLKEISDVDMLFFNSLCFNEKGLNQEFTKHFGQSFTDHYIGEKEFFAFNTLYPANINIKKETLEKVQDQIPDFGLATEWAFIGLVLSFGCKLKFCNQITWGYRISNSSASNSAKISIWISQKLQAIAWLKTKLSSTYLERHERVQILLSRRSILAVFYVEFWQRLLSKFL